MSTVRLDDFFNHSGFMQDIFGRCVFYHYYVQYLSLIFGQSFIPDSTVYIIPQNLINIKSKIKNDVLMLKTVIISNIHNF